MALSLALAAPALLPSASVVPNVRMAPARATFPSMVVGLDNVFKTKEDMIKASFLDIAKNPTDYKEIGRKFRQDVYSWEDWRWHRQAGHVAEAIPSVFTSGIGKLLWREIWFVVVAAVAVFGYNDLLPQLAEALEDVSEPLSDFLSARPLCHLSLLPLTLASPALFLLLVFRTNASYDRWWEARKIWGSTINTSRDHSRLCITMVEDEELRKTMVSHIACFSRTLKYHLSPPTQENENILKQELIDGRMSEEDIDLVMRAAHKPMTLLGLASKALHSERAGLDSMQRIKADQSLTLLMDHLGMCERIVKTPLPLVYTRHTARFLSWWLTWLPVCLYDQLPTHWMLIPVASIIAFFLVGIEELGNQIEEPFSILPLTAMGNGIQGSIFEALDISLDKIPEKGVVLPTAALSSNPNEFVR